MASKNEFSAALLWDIAEFLELLPDLPSGDMRWWAREIGLSLRNAVCVGEFTALIELLEQFTKEVL